MTCSEPDCTAAVFSKGLCQKHYKREYMRAFMAERRKTKTDRAVPAPKRQHRVKARFFAAIASGATFRDACAKAKVSPTVIYSWAEDSKDFQAKWDAAKPKPLHIAVQSTPKRSEERIRSDEALEAAIMRRGWQLTQMMRTPMCMWPSDWLSDD